MTELQKTKGETVSSAPEDFVATKGTQRRDAAFEQMSVRISAVQQRYAALTQFKGVLREGVDYGVIPGTKNPCLYQPGAQKLAVLFGLHARFEIVQREEDWTGEAHGGEAFFRYLVKCVLTDDDGNFVSESFGEINSWESRLRWRWLPEHKVPDDVSLAGLRRKITYVEEFDFAVQKGEVSGKYGKPPEYWDAFRRAIEDGTAVKVTIRSRSGKDFVGWRIQEVMYRLPNDDIFSSVNSLLKIAQKRAFVGAVLLGTGASEFFTQDLEDMSEDTLEGMGLRAPRSLADVPDDVDVGNRPSGEEMSEILRPARTVGRDESGWWLSGSGAKMVPQLVKLTGMTRPELFKALEAAGDAVSVKMTPEAIAAVLANPAAPGKSGSDAGERASDADAADDLPF